MCGRFVGYRNLDELKEFFPIDRSACEVSANYNVAPSQEILAIFKQQGQNWLDKFHWGLVPFWAKDASIGNRMINARAETVAEKPSFKNAFKKRRCLIIADGFYEWKGPKGQKQPLFITLPDKKPFAFAGLWEEWSAPDGAVLRTYKILTTVPSPAIAHLHDRMPLILPPDQEAAWLAGQAPPMAETGLEAYAVSPQVNRPDNDQPDLIVPLK